MKAYVVVTGIVFALILVAHIARVAAEGSHLLVQPVFLGTSLLSLGLTAWAGWLLGRRRGGQGK